MAVQISTLQALDYVTCIISLDPNENTVIPRLVGNLIKEIIGRMSNECEFFALICAAVYLVGSYRDRIKISKPDEYDFNVLMEFPKAEIVQDPEEMGTFRINMTAYVNGEDEYSLIRKCIDRQNFLMVLCLHNFFGSLLRRIHILDEPIRIDGHVLRMILRRAGPAYQFTVQTESGLIDPTLGYEFSLDFVPAIIFKTGDSFEETIGIPKPIMGSAKTEHTHFTPSFPRQEAFLMKDKQHLKMVLRLVKKIRDRFQIINLKSYFIKIIFLWVNKEKEDTYWDKSPAEILEEMLERILQHLKRRHIPFYWRPKFNMLRAFTVTDIQMMQQQFETVVKRFKNDQNTMRLLELFFDQKEMDAILFNPPKKDIRRRRNPEYQVFRRTSPCKFQEKPPRSRRRRSKSRPHDEL